MDAVDVAEAANTILEAPIVMVDQSGDIMDQDPDQSPDQEQTEDEDESILKVHPINSTDLTLTSNPTPLGYTWRCIINLVLPFVNGMMLGFGEILAHEVMFRWGWFGTRVYPPTRLQQQQRMGRVVGKSVLV